MIPEILYRGRSFAIKAHNDTNHMYDDYLPYEFHLKMAVQVGQEFMHLLTKEAVDSAEIFAAIWNHDTIEDCRVSYADLVGAIGKRSADIVFAVTNEKGKTRKDRASEKYYEGIRATKYATFVKLCDRIANVKYGKLTNGKVDMYRKEQSYFEESLNGAPIRPKLEGSANLELVKCWSMVEYLRTLLNP